MTPPRRLLTPYRPNICDDIRGRPLDAHSWLFDDPVLPAWIERTALLAGPFIRGEGSALLSLR